MFANPAASWYYGSQPSAQMPCEHCEGILRHERWCVTCDLIVQYAYAIVLDARKLTFRDGLILHSLGVSLEQDLEACDAGQTALT
jgi:hypothetical protein